LSGFLEYETIAYRALNMFLNFVNSAVKDSHFYKIHEMWFYNNGVYCRWQVAWWEMVGIRDKNEYAADNVYMYVIQIEMQKCYKDVLW